MTLKPSLPLSTNPLREGLERQLQYLEALSLEVIGDVDQPQICIACFCLPDECQCRAQILWPLPHAINLLRQRIAAMCGENYGR